MRSRTLVVIVMIGMLLLVSCSKGTDSSLQRNFRQGMLSPDIVNQLPQEKVYEGRPFYMPFQLVNNAAYPLKNVVVSFTGLDSTFVDVYTPEYRLSELEGVGQFNPVALPHDIGFDGAARYLRTGESFRDLPYRINVKFDSTFSFTPTVCIGSSLLDVESGSGCKIEGTMSYGGQGAPVGVVKMEQISYGQFGPQTEFRITVANRGPGEILSMKIKSSTIGTDPLRCFLPESTDPSSTTMTFKPQQKETTVLCVYDVASTASYKTPLSIDFEYEYEFSEKYNLKIMKAGRGLE